MTTSTATPAAREFGVFLQIDMLPTSFREVHGTRPRNFSGHAEASAYLDRMATAVLESADAHCQLAETVLAAGDITEAGHLIEQGTVYMRVHAAIVALQVPKAAVA